MVVQEAVGRMEGDATLMSGEELLVAVALVGKSSFIMPRSWLAIQSVTLLPRGSSWSCEYICWWWALMSPRIKNGSERSRERLSKLGM